MTGTIKEARQGQDRVRLRVGSVSMETDAVWTLQCHSHVSAADGTRADRRDEEVWQPGNVLRGRRGNSNANTRRPH